MIENEVTEMGTKEGKCYISGKTILMEDVMECVQCKKFALKEECENRKI